MKKCLFIAFSLMAAMASCTSEEDAILTVAPDAEVTFQVANYLSQTKADVTVAFPSDDTFGMFAWYDAEAPGAQHQTFMNNETISYDATNKVWKASKTYYWPKTGNLDFLGYYPRSEAPWINANATATKLTCTATSLQGTENFMYADMAMDYNQNPGAKYGYWEVTKGVPVLFHHALAKVTVKAKAQYLYNKDTEDASDVKWKVTLKQVLFQDMFTSGTLELNQASYTPGSAQQAAWVPADQIWAATGSQAAINGKTSSSDLVLTLEDQTTLDQYTVLPQSLVGRKMYVEYEIETTTATGKITEVIKREIPLDSEDSTLGKIWGLNKDITYSITVNPMTDEIFFDPAIVEWVDVNDPYVTPEAR